MAVALILLNKISQSITPDYTERVRALQFGDGYKQTMADGLNSNESQITVEWVGLTVAEAKQLKNFFQARKGVEKISYTPPLEDAVQYFSCTKHSAKLQSNSGTTWSYSAVLVREWTA